MAQRGEILAIAIRWPGPSGDRAPRSRPAWFAGDHHLYQTKLTLVWAILTYYIAINGCKSCYKAVSVTKAGAGNALHVS